MSAATETKPASKAKPDPAPPVPEPEIDDGPPTLDFLDPLELAHESDERELKKRVGRPSTYDPAFALAILKLVAGGFSINAALGKLGLHHNTAHDWAVTVPEFSEVLELAKGLRTFNLEDRALNSKKLSSAQASIYLRALSRANAKDWGESITIDRSNRGGELRDALLVLGRELHERLARSSQCRSEMVLVDLEDTSIDHGQARSIEPPDAMPDAQEKSPGTIAPGES